MPRHTCIPLASHDGMGICVSTGYVCAHRHELAILRGIDWRRARIDIVFVERNKAAVADFMRSLNYTLHARVHFDDVFLRRGVRLGEARGFSLVAPG